MSSSAAHPSLSPSPSPVKSAENQHQHLLSPQEALYSNEEISVGKLVKQKLDERAAKKEKEEKIRNQKEEERKRLEKERLMLIEYNREDGNYHDARTDDINRNTNARTLGGTLSKQRSGGGNGGRGGGTQQHHHHGLSASPSSISAAAVTESIYRNKTHMDSKNPDDPYYALIEKAMEKEAARRKSAKRHLNSNVERQHGNPHNSRGAASLNSSVRSGSVNNNNNSRGRRRSPSALSAGSGTVVVVSPNQRQGKNSSHSRFSPLPLSPTTSNKPPFHVAAGAGANNHHHLYAKNNNSNVELHDSAEIKKAIRACINAEYSRSFLSEQEALALSGGKVSYSISQRTTAFGNHYHQNQHNDHDDENHSDMAMSNVSSSENEQQQQQFAYLCVSIARCLIPSTSSSASAFDQNQNNNNNNNNVSHCTMIRKIASLLSNPVWNSKLATSSSSSSSLISLLAHGCIELVGSRETPSSTNDENTDNNKDQNEAGENDDDENSNNEKQNNLESPKKQNRRKAFENHDLVQWAMIHTASDSPSLFIALHCPPAADTLLPVGASNDDGLNDDQRHQLQNYYLLKKQQEQEHEQRLVKQRMQKEKDERTRVVKLKERRAVAKQKRREQFAHRFVNTVFHNIGAEEYDDDEEDDEENDHDEEEEEDLEREDLELIGQYEKKHPRGDGEIDNEEYQYAGQFIDQVFDSLLGGNNNINEGKQHQDEQDEQEYQEEFYYPTLNNNNQDSPPRSSGGSYFYYHHRDDQNALVVSNESNNNKKNNTKNQHQHHHNNTQASSHQYQSLKHTLKQLNLPPAHENVAIQICLAVDYFLTNESHGRKIKRVVVTCHDSVVELGGHLVMALRERMIARGSSRKVMCVTTSANLATNRLVVSKSHKKQKRQNERDTENKEEERGNDDPEIEKNTNEENENEDEEKDTKEVPPFSNRSPRDRALALRSFFARLCVPVPKLSFDKEQRRGWRFVVMPDCMAWALSHFAPIALLNYQSLDFPTTTTTADQATTSTPEKTAAANENEEQESNHENNNKNQQKRNNNNNKTISYCHPPTIDDVISHLWQALANIEGGSGGSGALDAVTGGATLAGFILASTTLMNGLISKPVADSIWDEVFSKIEEMYPREQQCQEENSLMKKKDDKSRTSPNKKPSSTALVVKNSSSSTKNQQEQQQQPTNVYQFNSPSFPSPPPICSCYNGALPSDYFSVREATFIRRLKTYRHVVRRVHHYYQQQEQQFSYATSTRGHLIPTASIKSYFMKNVAKRPFDALPQGDDQEWNKSFFSESFHEPHQILSRVSAKFLPPLSSALLLMNGGSESHNNNITNDSTTLINNNNNNGQLIKTGAAAAVVTGERGASVKRMREMFLKEGSKNATLVRLRLEERLARGHSAVAAANAVKKERSY